MVSGLDVPSGPNCLCLRRAKSGRLPVKDSRYSRFCVSTLLYHSTTHHSTKKVHRLHGLTQIIFSVSSCIFMLHCIFAANKNLVVDLGPGELKEFIFCIIISCMTKSEKLIEKFLSKPKNFTYDELKNLLNRFGYYEVKIGKTSGSRVAFMNKDTKNVIRLHKPHPGNILKRYQLDLVEEELKSEGVIQ
jgi:hypothetical protein